MSAPVITFVSDYGLEDVFVGICHGVLARICPEARVIDITHGIARHDVRGGRSRCAPRSATCRPAYTWQSSTPT